MNKNKTLIVVFLLLISVVSAIWKQTVCLCESTKSESMKCESAKCEFSAESKDLTLKLEKIGKSETEGIRLVSLVDKKSGRVFCELPSRPLFSLIFCPAGHPEQQTYAHADTTAWNSVSCRTEENHLAVSWKGFSGADGAGNLSVEMRIEASPDKEGIELSYSARAGSGNISIAAVQIGQFAFRDTGTHTKMFLPWRSGVVYDNPSEKGSFQWKYGYPGYDVAMPWFVLWNESESADSFRSINNTGIYLGFHDAEGARKEIECVINQKDPQYPWRNTVSFLCTVQAENMYEPDNEFSVGGKAVLRTIRNNWYDGALIYRDWVCEEASWYPREKLDGNGRTDSPQWLKEHCLWAMYRVNPEEMIPAMKKFREAFGVPAAVHWYYWHKNPYDNDYPHFFPRDGFGEAVRELQKDGDIFIMPYINGLLWDTRDCGLEDCFYSKEAVPGTCKNVHGKPLVHSYGSKESDGSDVRLAHMCSTAPVWQHKVRENVLRLTDEYGTKAVYVDQVAADVPELCFDRSHGHPLGGGHWWNKGYGSMFETIHADLHERKHEDAAIATECTGETSLSIVDAFLTWHHQLEHQVPAFSAVYGGAIQMVGRDYRAGKTYAERTAPHMTVTNEPLACRMKAAESLCFGEQIGWFVPTIIDEADKFPFLRDVVRLRYQLRQYFYRGEMCRVPDFSNMPEVTADWNYYDSPLITAPAVRTGCWRITENGRTKSVIVLFANTSPDDITSRVRIHLQEAGLGNSTFSVVRIHPDGTKKAIEVGALNQPLHFPKESVFAWEIAVK
ncbi:MAG: DUF6259 domain-containing protein [Planctomycetaceae bacterium]|jgi:hypothetical protein|nr:DUF6259 domain-containing protein [Planctomycetaceae bacterium]